MLMYNLDTIITFDLAVLQRQEVLWLKIFFFPAVMLYRIE